MSSRLRNLPHWIKFTALTLGIGAAWWAAVVILPGEGWGNPGKVTAFGLVALVVFVVVALVTHSGDWKKMDRDRIERKRGRRSSSKR